MCFTALDLFGGLTYASFVWGIILMGEGIFWGRNISSSAKERPLVMLKEHGVGDQTRVSWAKQLWTIPVTYLLYCLSSPFRLVFKLSFLLKLPVLVYDLWRFERMMNEMISTSTSLLKQCFCTLSFSMSTVKDKFEFWKSSFPI